MGLDGARDEATQLVVRGVRPVPWEGPEHNLGCGSQQSEGIPENLVCALKLFGEPAEEWRQPRGHDRGRFAEQDEITNELRGFIEEDNREAVKIGDLEKNSEAIKVVKPKFNKEIHQNASI